MRHSRPRRLSSTEIWVALKAAGRGAFYLVMGVCFVGSVTIGVVEIVERDRHRTWGTFTETSTTCDYLSRRRSCQSIGTWVSDEGAVVKEGIRLDGHVHPGESVRASFRPGGLMGDDGNNIVHSARSSAAGVWVPWMVAVATVVVALLQRRRWRASALP